MAIPAAGLLAFQIGGSLFGGALEASAGRAEARALEFAADNESINAIIRNNERLDRLIDVMAANNVTSGASGVQAFSGSPLTVLQENIKTASKRGISDFNNARLSELSLRSTAFARRRSSQLSVFASLLGTSANIAKTGITSAIATPGANPFTPIAPDLQPRLGSF